MRYEYYVKYHGFKMKTFLLVILKIDKKKKNCHGYTDNVIIIKFANG